jgi:2-methylcitrate dehydratase PrpD
MTIAASDVPTSVGEGGFDAIAEWAIDRAGRPIEPGLLSTVRARMLDYVANVAGGSARESVRTLGRHAAHAGGPIPVPGDGTAPLDRATLPWGAAAHVLEFDDTHQGSSSHPGAPIFTTTLLLGAELGRSLDDVARATLVGYEVMCRLGETTGPQNEYDRGFHPTGTCGTFGAAAAASVMLGLDVDGLRSALGIAGSFSAGSMAFLTNGAWTKILHPGHAARDGIIAAELAADGYKGPVDPLAPPHGYFAGHAPAGTTPAVAPPADGEALTIERTSVKAHGCCRYEQGPIDALLELRARHALDPADVVRVEVAVLRAGWDIIAEPLEPKRRPASAVDAQFSMPFGAALALVRGHATPFDHDDVAIHDPELLRVADLVACRIDEGLEAQFPQKWPAIVDVELRDGTVLRAEVEFPKGDPENPHTLDELVARVGDVAPWVSADRLERAVAPLRDGDFGLPARELVSAIAGCFATTG